MTDHRLPEWLDAAHVCPDVLALRPDYTALLLTAEGLQPGPNDAYSERALADAEARARELLARSPLEDQPHLRQWREAFKAFGAKPNRTRPSVDGLLRRVADGLPRIDRLTDVYNAVSISHVVPVGGEDLDHYAGPLRLVRATGDERFDTTVAGAAATEQPEPGEVVWRDDLGVTCRRWNWRQCTRTRLTGRTVRAVFILDGLGALGTSGLSDAGHELGALLGQGNPGVRLHLRVLGPGETGAAVRL